MQPPVVSLNAPLPASPQGSGKEPGRVELWLRSLRRHLTDREAVIRTVSRLIQSSPVAWRRCFIYIIVASIVFTCTQVYLAWGETGVRWQNARRVYVAAAMAISLMAFVSLHMQVRGLIGVDGILPFQRHAADKIRRFPPEQQLLHWDSMRSAPCRWAAQALNVLEARWWARGCRRHGDGGAPLQYWFAQPDSGLTDAKLTGLCWIGEATTLFALLSSLTEGNTCECSLLCAALEFALGAARVTCIVAATLAYRILRSATGPFLGLQWDVLILEHNMITVLAALPLLPNAVVPALMLPQQLLGFKLMLGSGVVKRRTRCPRWAASTAMDLHYETQPIPHLVSYYVHNMPHWVHAQECWIAFLIQLFLPFLTFGPRLGRLLAFLGYSALMIAIMCTGCYGFFNLQTLAIALGMLDDSMLPFGMAPSCEPWHPWVVVAVTLVLGAVSLWVASAVGLALLHLPRGLRNVVTLAQDSTAGKIFSWQQNAHDCLYSLGVGHWYGPFGGMTCFRWELIFEISDDRENWRQLEFPYKPGCIDTPPRFMPPGHFARLDWRLWFVPLSMARGCWDMPQWVEGFIAGLLRGSAHVAGLTLARDEIVRSPPVYVRTSVWDYHMRSCDPSVHQCDEVRIKVDERDRGYGLVRGPATKRSPSLGGVSDDSSSASSAHPTEFGKWWYRRRVRMGPVYYLEDGRLNSNWQEGVD
eukprot:TRINITY_DN11947_c0_g1_i1.p1 TRINITY_DN11947_c0_g1~~TRINITY_DN11947_c0_g1_i1.p1  ORF type:complete len:699 (+),score=152.36 TRINITY_DN11947_c0_g1_i1:103-2199(+)